MFKPFFALGILLSIGASAQASQGSGNAWLGFAPGANLIISAPEVGADDVQEKDYATGDFDQDGWTDLVVVRKKPLDTAGRLTNVLFMNRGGKLVDRTAALASQSDVAGDQGFLTQTNDRDVVAVDVDGDGWLDLITATTLSPQLPKHLSHPRVYRNLGLSAQGRWLGFRYEQARFPQLLLADGSASWPRFTCVSAGDVTGDGFPDLYFGDNDKRPNFGGGDMNDRLLINDGSGFFSDETTVRMQPQDLVAEYVTSASIVDMNQDGTQDIVRNRGYFLGVSIAYNQPGFEGDLTVASDVAVETPYFTSVGDLNQDGLPDLIVSSNDQDVAIYHTGNDANGLATFSAPAPFEYEVGGDLGFASNSEIVDLDGDGWNDVVVCDFDIELSGCDRYMHIFRNLGGLPGAPVVLREEAGPTSAGWRGAAGLFPTELAGTHDVAIFDLDLDGDLDLVVGHCTGTDVWLNRN